MRHFIIAMGLALAIPAHAADRPECDQADAESRWTQAVEGGVVEGASFLNDKLTIHLKAASWDAYPLEVRIGMFVILDCVIAGPDGRVTEAQAVDEGGRILATWDGIKQQIDVK